MPLLILAVMAASKFANSPSTSPDPTLMGLLLLIQGFSPNNCSDYFVPLLIFAVMAASKFAVSPRISPYPTLMDPLLFFTSAIDP